MQSAMFKPSRHSSPSRTTPRPVVRIRGPVHPSRHSKSNQSSPSPISSHVDSVSEPECDAAEPTTNPDPKDIRRNSLYLTFNAPQVDDYHRAIFLAHPPSTPDQSLQFSGTLFHAAFTSPEGLQTSPRRWVEEVRPVRDVTSSDSLVLLYRISTLDPNRGSIESQCDLIRNVLSRVPLGRQNRERILGPLAGGEGNPALENYDCIIVRTNFHLKSASSDLTQDPSDILRVMQVTKLTGLIQSKWTTDAMTALADAGIVSFANLGFENAGKPRKSHSSPRYPILSHQKVQLLQAQHSGGLCQGRCRCGLRRIESRQLADISHLLFSELRTMKKQKRRQWMTSSNHSVGE
ncbi:unnamed protein product [Diplocarpon coronariae]